jgi:hypothetical protein
MMKRRLVLLVAMTALSGAWGSTEASRAEAAETATNHYTLTLDGATTPITGITADATPTSDDITFKVGPQTSAGLVTWVQSIYDTTHPRLLKNGLITTISSDNKEVGRLSFANAVVTEVTFPALDTAGNNNFDLTVKIHPTSSRREAGSGAVVQTLMLAPIAKPAPVSGFKLSITGLEAVCSHTIHVDAFTIQRPATADPRTIGPGPVVPNVKFTVPKTDLTVLTPWQQQHALNTGNSGSPNGMLVYVSAAPASVFRIDLVSVILSQIVLDPGTQNVKITAAANFIQFAPG